MANNYFETTSYRPSFLGDLELEADLIHDYTAALQLDDPGWFSHTHIEDTEWQEQGWCKILEHIPSLFICMDDYCKIFSEDPVLISSARLMRLLNNNLYHSRTLRL